MWLDYFIGACAILFCLSCLVTVVWLAERTWRWWRKRARRKAWASLGVSPPQEPKPRRHGGGPVTFFAVCDCPGSGPAPGIGDTVSRCAQCGGVRKAKKDTTLYEVLDLDPIERDLMCRKPEVEPKRKTPGPRGLEWD